MPLVVVAVIMLGVNEAAGWRVAMVFPEWPSCSPE